MPASTPDHERSTYQTPARLAAMFSALIVLMAVVWIAAAGLVVASLNTGQDLFATPALAAAIALTIAAGIVWTRIGQRRLLAQQGTLHAAQHELLLHLAAVAGEVEQISVTGLGRSRELVRYVGELAATQASLAGELGKMRELLSRSASRGEAGDVRAGTDDGAARTAVSEAFETGRRIGQRQAVRAMNGSGSPMS